MSLEYVTQQNDMVDAVAFRIYGFAEGAAEAIFVANYGLASQLPMLPENLTLILPDIGRVSQPPKQTVNLWD